MSIFRARTSLLSLSPSVTPAGDGLRVRTNALVRVLSLGSYDRRVYIDPRRRTITIERRRLWLWTDRRVIRFSDVAYIDYGFSSLGTSWSWWPGWLQRDDQLESFPVSVVLRGTEEPVPIAVFRGEGSVHNGLGGVLLGDSAIDAEGDQEDASRELVDWLVDTTGAPLGRPLLSRELEHAAADRFARIE